MQSIASARNPLLKEIRKALQRGALTESGCMVAETFHLLDEALRSYREVRVVLAAESAQTDVARRLAQWPQVRWNVVPDALFAQIASTETSQGVIALVPPPEWTMEHLFTDRSLLVVLDGVQDPGNAGTIVRAAEAFGATGALFLKGCVSPFNAKTIRASAGSLFRLPFLHGVDAEHACRTLEQRGVRLYTALPRAAVQLDSADFAQPCAIAIGSEAHGVSDKLKSESTPMSIPTAGVESLNAAMAASVILYEASRQRRRGEA